MCAPLSAYASNLCAQYRAVPQKCSPTKLAQYLQVGRLTQAEYDTIIDPACECGWIVPALLAQDAPQGIVL